MITAICMADVRGVDLAASEPEMVSFFSKDKCALDTLRFNLGAACEDTTVCAYVRVCVQGESPKCCNYRCSNMNEPFSSLANRHVEVVWQIQRLQSQSCSVHTHPWRETTPPPPPNLLQPMAGGRRSALCLLPGGRPQLHSGALVGGSDQTAGVLG